ncbi:MAG: DUF1501 domain-containing protein [Ilumatobacter sp.]
MTPRISRREMIAWLAAGTGAAATGASVFLGDQRSSSKAPTPGSPSSESTVPRIRSTAASADAGDPTTIQANSVGSRLLVVVEMPGGNDGLSTAVPYGDGAYYDLRDQTAIAERDVLDLDGRLGLHPSLERLHRRGVSVVQGIGSSTPDGSHFEMQARWWSGNSAVIDSSTGWIGRVADLLAHDAAASGPATALSVGSGSHPIIRSVNGTTIAMPNANALWAVAGADPDDERAVAYQRALRSMAAADSPIGESMRAGLDFAELMIELELDEAAAEDLGYEGWGLGRGLQFAASVLDGDVGIRVVHVRTQGDYDTHDGHSWKYPQLMTEVDANVEAFHRDIEQRGLADRVMVMTTSEFGRTARENANGGLDHGTASTMLLSGPGTDQVLGEAPLLTTRDANDDLIAPIRFEDYLGGVVEGWLDVPASEVFGSNATPLDLF